MGAADIVPGVSGGTMALIFGIYRDLIANVRAGARALGRFVRGDLRGGFGLLGSVDWLFLLPLLAGIGAAVLALTSVIEGLLETQPVRMAAVFFGLVVASIVVAWRLIGRRDPARLAVLIGTGVVTFALLGLRSGPVGDPSGLVFLASGAVAICAMILPGVSGSFLLLMMGMYAAVLDAANSRDLVSLGLFLVGCVVGLALFSTGLNWALEWHHDTVMAALVGLMAGSLRVLWPWPDGVGIPELHDESGAIVREATSGTALGAPSEDLVIAVALAVVAATAVLVISAVAERRSTQVERV
jgi:putative membrane protein